MNKHVSPSRQSGLDREIGARLAWLERQDGQVVTLSTRYPDGYRIAPHHHSRSQLLHPHTGVVLVMTDQGRWMVPPEYAMWIPAGMEHSVDILGDVLMNSVYVMPGAVEGLPAALRVVGLTALVRCLIEELASLPEARPSSVRAGMITELLLHEIPGLPQQPLGLPFPADPKLAALCRKFVAAPSARATIDDWADALGMSRRAFTRAFARETGISLSTWRQQACLLAALPRLAEGESVIGVALDLGYESVPAFTTMFKRMLGTSPRRYLARAREGVEG